MASRKPSYRPRQPHLREGIPNFTPKPTRAVPAPPPHCPSPRAWILSTPPASCPSLLSLEWVVEPLNCSPASTHSKLGFHPLTKKPRKTPIPESVKMCLFPNTQGSEVSRQSPHRNPRFPVALSSAHARPQLLYPTLSWLCILPPAAPSSEPLRGLAVDTSGPHGSPLHSGFAFLPAQVRVNETGCH